MYTDESPPGDVPLESTKLEVISENTVSEPINERVSTLSKCFYDHLAVDEYQDILMSYQVIDKNHTEMPKTVLSNANRTDDGVSVSNISENFIFEDTNLAYLDLLESPFKG